MYDIVTVTLHPAIDRLMAVKGLQLGDHARGRMVVAIPAGKGVNTSRVLSQLGVASIATGLVGRGELAQYEKSLTPGPVQPQFLAVEGRTRENITLIDREAGQETHIRDQGCEIREPDRRRLRNKLNLLAAKDRVFVIAGSLPPGVEPAFVWEVIDLVAAKGVKVALDGPGKLLRELGDRRLWLLKPNREELAAMMGESMECDDALIAAGRELSQQVRAVIVSCGAAGGYLFTDGAAMIGQVEVDPNQVKSAVGCGDALTAGYIAAQQQGKSIRDAYAYGLAVATAAALEGRPGYVKTEAIDELCEKTSVETVK